jgi:hypothetical protein
VRRQRSRGADCSPGFDRYRGRYSLSASPAASQTAAGADRRKSLFDAVEKLDTVVATVLPAF